MRVARYPDDRLRRGVGHEKIAATIEPVFGGAKSVADLFRCRRTIGEPIAVEGLREALRQRQATAAQIAREAHADGVWRTMQPCLTGRTSDA